MHLNDRVFIINLLIIAVFLIAMIMCDSDFERFGQRSNEIVGAQILVAPIRCRPGRIYWRGVCRKIIF